MFGDKNTEINEIVLYEKRKIIMTYSILIP